MSQKPVILYGASGYTGRLIAEFLREYQLPFVAAGRDTGRVEEAMKLVPGIETAVYDVVAVEHTLDALVELFTGAKVVCNTVGPFARFGSLVVEAALKAGCHYLDTTGEQEWIIETRDTFGEAYAEKGLLLAPATAYMFATAHIASETCLEEKGINTLDIACIPTGVPTVGSTRTLMDLCRIKQCWLKNGELVALENPLQMPHEVVVPGMCTTVLALPWGGGCVPVWYANDPRVLNCKSVTGFNDRPLVQGIMGIGKHFDDNLKDLPNDEQEAALNDMAAGFTPGSPPRENHNVHRTVDIAWGLGNNKAVKCTILGNSAYLQTGLIQAFVAKTLVKGTPKAVGFQSSVTAVGHRDLLSELESYGYCRMTVEKV